MSHTRAQRVGSDRAASRATEANRQEFSGKPKLLRLVYPRTEVSDAKQAFKNESSIDYR